MWALGCVVAEMFIGSALFLSYDLPNQLYTIFKVLGFPTRGEVAYMGSAYDDLVFPGVMSKGDLEERLPALSPSALDLLKRMLRFDAGSRPSFEEILHHPYLSDMEATAMVTAGTESC